MAPTLLGLASKFLTHADHEIPDDISAIEYICNWLRTKMLESANKFGGLEDRLLIIVAKTASGKSTAMPVEIFKLLKNSESTGDYRGRGVLVTQPRVGTAIDISENQIGKAPWNNLEFGVDVGYQTGSYTTKPNYNNLLFATIGVLRAQLDNNDDDFILSKYQFIIIDEAHERSLDTDCTLMKLKYLYLRNKDNPKIPFLILTSATIDVDKYAKYFGLTNNNIINVEGASFPKQTYWTETDADDLNIVMIDTIMNIHTKNINDKPRQCDIMIFVSSTKPYQKNNIKEILEAKADDLLVVFMDRDEIQAFSDSFQYVTGRKELPPQIRRMVIFATNSAETGLTIESLKYVIDSGMVLNNEIYSPSGINGLVNRPIAQSNIEQRKGRCGRAFPGDFYPLYTEKTFNLLQKQGYPDIVSLGMDTIILDTIKAQQEYKSFMKKRPEFLIEDMDLLDLPPMDSLLLSLDKCLTFGYTSYNAPLNTGKLTGYGITDLGKVVNKLLRDLTLETARIILTSYTFKLSTNDAILLACVCHRDFSTFNRNIKKKNILQYCLPSQFIDVEDFRNTVKCEIIELLVIYSTILYNIESDTINTFLTTCQDLISRNDILKIVWKYQAITKSMINVGMSINDNPETKIILADTILEFMEIVIQLKVCLYSGFLFNTLRLNDKGRYVNRHGIPFYIQLPKNLIKPKVIITDLFQMQANNFNPYIKYDIKVRNICVIDGFVGDIIDNLFYTQCRT